MSSTNCYRLVDWLFVQITGQIDECLADTVTHSTASQYTILYDMSMHSSLCYLMFFWLFCLIFRCLLILTIFPILLILPLFSFSSFLPFFLFYPSHTTFPSHPFLSFSSFFSSLPLILPSKLSSLHMGWFIIKYLTCPNIQRTWLRIYLEFCFCFV